jgi:glyoxylase-like metal-dependent hydrolase (beta-lactamase superfamily II)
MRASVRLVLVTASLWVGGALPALAAAAEPGFVVQEVAPGIFAAVRREPPGFWFDCNSVFVVNDHDVVVVDTNVSPSSARATLAALRKITDKPVSHVVNTHWHDDHIAGNQIYRDAFPGVRFVGHVRTRGELATTGAANRKSAVEAGPGFAKYLRKLVADGKSLAGGAITDEERAAYASDASLVERYLADAGTLEVVFPDVAVDGTLTLQRGARTIEIRHLGRGHTASDLVVYLPKERVAIVGDLVSWPVPLVGTTSHPADFAATLDALLSLHADVFVPGHGPVLKDDAYVRLVARLLSSIRDQTAAAVARGETLEQARKSVDLSEFRRAIAGDSQLRKLGFDNYVADPGVAVAYREAKEKG